MAFSEVWHVTYQFDGKLPQKKEFDVNFQIRQFFQELFSEKIWGLKMAYSEIWHLTPHFTQLAWHEILIFKKTSPHAQVTAALTVEMFFWK